MCVPTSACFDLFIEPAGLESWLCEKANVEARTGGLRELFWEPDDPQNNSTVGCRITTYDRDRVSAFQWRSPKQFKSFANAADPLTHVVVDFHGNSNVTSMAKPFARFAPKVDRRSVRSISRIGTALNETRNAQGGAANL